MAFNRSSISQSELPGPLHHPPGYGLLTRTLVRSPVVKQIIPGRIRGKNYNDVIFIGETFIELYLLSDDGKLRKVATKADFQADIRHARVCVFDSAAAMGAHSLAGYGIPPDLKEESMPPHMLVLSLDSGHIAFLFAQQRGPAVHFIMSTRRIDAKGPHPKHLGKSLAIDPTSRFLAVAAYQDTFRLFALYDTEEIARQLHEGLQLNPIKEEKTFHVNGVILHMEFLHPPANDRDHVTILLVIVDSKQKFRLMMYEWVASNSLQTVMKHGQQGLRLSDDLSMPLHVIPLLIDRGFLMITEFAIYALRADEVGSGRSNFAKHAFPQTDRGEGRQSLVTSWARPLRTATHTKTMDDLYLAMEDGDIYFIEVEVGGPNLVQLVNKAGTLDCAVGTAFAALDYGLQRNDLLVAGGEMSSGGVYLLKIGPTSPLSDPRADEEPRLEETVANWSPVFDFDLINPIGDRQPQGKAMRDRMYACTGRALHGAIAEIRHGIQASIQTTVTYEPGVGQIWAITDPDEKGFFILCAQPDRSTLCFLKNSGDWEDVSQCDLLDMHHTTLAAALVDHRTVQITTNAINVNQVSDRFLNSTELSGEDVNMGDGGVAQNTQMWSRRCEGNSVIVGAAISGIFMVVAVRSEGLLKVTLVSLRPSPDESGNLLNESGTPVELKEDPSSITIIGLEGSLFAAIGTRAATVLFYLIDAENGLQFVHEESMIRGTQTPDEMEQQDLYICESVCPIKSDTTSQLLCGLRDGTLRTFNVELSLGRLNLTKLEDIQFGPIPVKILKNIRRQDSVLLLAGPELYQFQLVGGETIATQIVFEGSAAEPALAAVCYIDNLPYPEIFVVCVTRDSLFYAELGHFSKECVRRLPLEETPRRLLYNKTWNMLIVACSKSISRETNERLPGGGKKQIRITMCSLKFLDPQTCESKLIGELCDKTSGDLIFGQPNEQIYGLCEWNVRIEGRRYQYIAIGTGFLTETQSQPSKGSVIILSASVVDGAVQAKRRYQISLDAPVYSVAPYGTSSLVYCSGNRLVLVTLNMQRKKPEVTAEFKLRSPAVQITVREPFINVSCARDSLCVLKVDTRDTTGGTETTISTWFSDQITRNAFSHFSPQEDIFLISDKHYGIAGLWQPPERRNNGSLTTLFDTQVGSSISRIRCGSLRPPWKAHKARPGVIMPEKDIIGSGVDGSIYQIVILNEDASQLLRYIQGLYITYRETERTQGFTDDLAEDVVLKGDIDGDLLLVVTKLGPQWLRNAVEKSEADGHARSAPTFEDMMRRVFANPAGENVAEGFNVEKALEYMKELLEGIVL